MGLVGGDDGDDDGEDGWGGGAAHGSPPPSDLVVAFSSVSSSIQTISHARTRSVCSASRWCLCCCSGCCCRGTHSPSLSPLPAASGGSGSWRLPLPGTCSPGGVKQGCASRFKGGFTNKAVRVRGGGLHHPRLSSHHTPAAAVSLISVILKSVPYPPCMRPGTSWSRKTNPVMCQWASVNDAASQPLRGLNGKRYLSPPHVILLPVPRERAGRRVGAWRSSPGPSGESTAYRLVRPTPGAAVHGHCSCCFLVLCCSAPLPRRCSAPRRRPWQKCSNRNVCQWNSSGLVRWETDHDAAVPFIKLLQPCPPRGRRTRRGAVGGVFMCRCYVCVCL